MMQKQSKNKKSKKITVNAYKKVLFFPLGEFIII